MSSRSQQMRRNKGRMMTDSFVRIPHHVVNHENFRTLSCRATKLLIDLLAQYRGYNNGDLCAPLSLMRERGLNSSDQLQKAKNELVKTRVIIVTRQGALNKCSLYAVTWFPIDECKGKLDIASTTTASVDWMIGSPDPSHGS